MKMLPRHSDTQAGHLVQPLSPYERMALKYDCPAEARTLHVRRNSVQNKEETLTVDRVLALYGDFGLL